jgi:hypothetical protein
MFDSIRRRVPVLFAGLMAVGLPVFTPAQDKPPEYSDRPFSNNLVLEGSLPGATLLQLEVLDSRQEPVVVTLQEGRLQAGINLEQHGGQRVRVTGTNPDGKQIYAGEFDLEVNGEFVPSVAVELKSEVDGTAAGFTIASHRIDIEFAGVQREGELYTRVTASAYDANGRRLDLKEGELQWGSLDPWLHENLLECPVSHGGTPLCAEFLPAKFRERPEFDACLYGKICFTTPAPPIPPVWRKVAVGLGGHACALKLDGELYCWGEAENGQLGYSAAKDCTVSGGAGSVWACSGFPGLVMCGSTACHFTDVTAGLNHTCALDANQDAWCWGENQDGQLGLDFFDTTIHGSPVPRKVFGGLKFKSIQAAFSMTCGLTTTHQVFCWGKNSLGVIPTLQDGWANDPRLVATPEPIADIDFSWDHVCGRVSNGHLYCWGSNWKSQLGSLSFPTAPTCSTCPGMPLLMQANIPALANQQVTMVSAGASGTCAHLASGATPCWGKALPAYPGGRTLDRLSRGNFHYCAISRGNMECAGASALGDGSTFHALPGVGPVQVKPSKNFREVDTGTEVTCAIASDENVYCWGNSTYGQLGLGLPSGYVTQPTALQFPIVHTLKIPPKHWLGP